MNPNPLFPVIPLCLMLLSSLWIPENLCAADSLEDEPQWEEVEDFSELAEAYQARISELRDLDRHDEAMELSDKLLALPITPESASAHRSETIARSHFRMQQGEWTASILQEAEEAMADLRQSDSTEDRLEASKFLAQIYALAGQSDKAIELLHESIAEAKHLELPRLVAELLFVRAKVRWKEGAWELAERDFIEALSIFRSQGNWRRETRSHLLYAKLLLDRGLWDRAREISLRGIYLAKQLDDDALRRELLKIRDEVFEQATEERGIDASLWADLQPLTMVTHVAGGELARGRFVLSNPTPATVEGDLVITGGAVAMSWNASQRVLAVELDPWFDAEPLRHTVSIPPDEAVTIYLQTSPDAVGFPGRAVVDWTGSPPQRATWEFGVDPFEEIVEVVTESTAMENPFYAVPLYQEIYYRGDGKKTQSLRVRVSHPCRVEIVDQVTGGLLAVDATGDGNFSSAGDAVYRDSARDGYPDLPLSTTEDVAALLIYLFPEDGFSDRDLTVEVDLQEEGQWRVASTNVWIASQAKRE